MIIRYIALTGVAAIALGAVALSDVAMSATAPAVTRVATAPARATVPLTNIPAASLQKLRVENTAGEAVGTVLYVITQSDGKPLALTVDASDYLGAGHQVVSFQSNQLGLDTGRRVLIASMTRAQIKALASNS